MEIRVVVARMDAPAGERVVEVRGGTKAHKAAIKLLEGRVKRAALLRRRSEIWMAVNGG